LAEDEKRIQEDILMSDADSQNNASGRVEGMQSTAPLLPVKDLVMNPITSFLVFVFLAGTVAAGFFGHPYSAGGLFVVAVLIGLSLKVANVWQKFVILRLGQLQSVRGAGVFVIIPLLTARNDRLLDARQSTIRPERR
jgi:hypothetical protein